MPGSLSIETAVKPQDMADDIQQAARFITFTDSRDVYYYKDGIYVSNGEAAIEKAIEKVVKDATTHFVNEVIDHIRRRTYMERADVDLDWFYVAVKNGLIDLRSGQFMKHSPDIILLNRLPVEYDPKATCPNFARFLRQAQPGDPDGRTKLLDHMAACLDRRSRKRRALLAVGERDTGKALAVDTPIPTPEGWKEMGSLEIGDQVFDERGKICSVTMATNVMYGHQCYRVKFDDGSSLLADADHLWASETLAYRRSVSRQSMNDRIRGTSERSYQDRPRCVRRIQPAILTTEQIAESLFGWVSKKTRRRDHNHTIPCTAPLHLPERPLPMDPYTLGVWLGDGASHRNAITTMSEEVLVGLTTAGHTLQVLVPPGGYQGKAGTYYVDREAIGKPGPFQKFLRASGLQDNKHIPQEYLRASREQRLQLLDGLMDTDGYIGPRSKGNSCVFYSTIKRLADDAAELVVSLGWKAWRSKKMAKIYGVPKGLVYLVRFRPDANVFTINRKKSRLDFSVSQAGASKRRVVVDVEPVGSVPVRCIMVDSPSHLYLAGSSMVPTHNSTLFNVIEALLGKDNVSNVPLQQLCGDDKFATAQLYGKMANIYADLGNIPLKYLGQFKAITGGDWISAQAKHKPMFDFLPHVKLLFSCNKPPDVKDITDEAFFSRWDVVYFRNQVKGEDKDENLKERLTTPEELSGLLNILIGVMQRQVQTGAFKLEPSPTETRDYWLSEAEPARIFLKDNVIAVPDGVIKRSVLYRRWTEWRLKRSLVPVSEQRFNQLIEGMFKALKTSKKIGGSAEKVWLGLKFRDEANKGQEELIPEVTESLQLVGPTKYRGVYMAPKRGNPGNSDSILFLGFRRLFSTL
jgi:phage/plasmid-associated DNA primase